MFEVATCLPQYMHKHWHGLLFHEKTTLSNQHKLRILKHYDLFACHSTSNQSLYKRFTLTHGPQLFKKHCEVGNIFIPNSSMGENLDTKVWVGVLNHKHNL
jgi:hypothetical protein